MSKKLPEDTLVKLRELEPKLIAASKYGKFAESKSLMTEIQRLFLSDRDHHRLLQAKNWYFQAALEDNQIDYAKRGFESIRIRANSNTRIYLEATTLLGICFLRKREIEKAKEYIRETILNINNIKSDNRRTQLQKRIIERIEFECILGQLQEQSPQAMKPAEIQRKAIELLNSKSDQEIFGMIGNSLPQSSLELTHHIKDYSVKLLPVGDQKLLAPPKTLSIIEFGRKVVETVKRAGWRAICDEKSELYHLWQKQVPEFFNKGYFASAIAVTCAKFSIGASVLAIGVTAILMKYTATEFCSKYKPIDIMIGRNEKD
ncbi:MAG: hypothetical protein D3919_04090 [Candidatus Electrothrix sp. AW5]|nr:hypothetical protein [Candidatus Electrothrix gigas]